MIAEGWIALAVGAFSAVTFFVQRRDIHWLAGEQTALQRRLADIEEQRRRDETKPKFELVYVRATGNAPPGLRLTNRGPAAVGDLEVSIIYHPDHPAVVSGFLAGHREGWITVEDLEEGHTADIELNERQHGPGGELRLRWRGQVAGDDDVEGVVTCEVPGRHEPMVAFG